MRFLLRPDNGEGKKLVMLVLKARFSFLPSTHLSNNPFLTLRKIWAHELLCTLGSNGFLYDDNINTKKGTFLLRNLGMYVTCSEFFLGEEREFSVTVLTLLMGRLRTKKLGG